MLVLTHVPPFREAARYRGEISTPDFTPYFASKAAGDAIRDAAEKHPETQFIVLCGHTHWPADVSVLPNLRVLAAAAEYGCPTIQGSISLVRRGAGGVRIAGLGNRDAFISPRFSRG